MENYFGSLKRHTSPTTTSPLLIWVRGVCCSLTISEIMSKNVYVDSRDNVSVVLSWTVFQHQCSFLRQEFKITQQSHYLPESMAKY